MSKRELCQLWLTCDDVAEASLIAKALLEARLVVCAKQIPVTADYWWRSKIGHAGEIAVVMDSALDLFDQVEELVRNLHSYETFVLQAFPMSRISTEAEQWLDEELAEEMPSRKKAAIVAHPVSRASNLPPAHDSSPPYVLPPPPVPMERPPLPLPQAVPPERPVPTASPPPPPPTDKSGSYRIQIL